MISSDIISSGGIDNILKDLYIDESQLEYQRKRYINALNRFTQLYGEGDVFIFSAPGRSEIGGNHTDHQNGKVLAAASGDYPVYYPHEGFQGECVRGRQFIWA